MKKDFEKWIVEHWPPNVPNDCTQLSRSERDCIERNINERDYCESCMVYVLLTKKFEEEEQ